MPESPAVSVVIPCHDHARFLRQALASVAAQGWPWLEVVVVDDASQDDPGSVVRSFDGLDLRLVKHATRRGAAAARNAGLAATSYEVVAFLDADDLWPAGRLAALVHRMGSTGAPLAFGRAEEFSDELGLQGLIRPGARDLWAAGTTVMDRSLFDTVGTFDEGLNTAEFVDFGSRVRAAGVSVARVDQVVLNRRIHRGNAGRIARSGAADYTSVVRRHLARLGAANREPES